MARNCRTQQRVDWLGHECMRWINAMIQRGYMTGHRAGCRGGMCHCPFQLTEAGLALTPEQREQISAELAAEHEVTQ
jgi:hypothetical protein